MRTEVELLPTSCSGVILVSDHYTVFLTHPLTDIRVAASVTITTNIAGTILCVCGLGHMCRCFLGKTLNDWIALQVECVNCPIL